MMLSNQLKQLAKDYNLLYAQQLRLNAEGMSNDTAGFHNETCIRGAKSIVDKADVGYVMAKVNDKEWHGLQTKLANYRDPQTGDAFVIPNVRPNMVLDVYKNRRGRFTNVRIWCTLDLGTGERRDLYMTYADNTPISTREQLIGVSTEEIAKEWNVQCSMTTSASTV